MIRTMKEAEDLVYHSFFHAYEHIPKADDSIVKKPELTRKLLNDLGAPDRGQSFILVTGSKGKGSTARFISSLLAHHGLKVGFFSSPHLVHFNERIRINGKAISDEDFIRISRQIAKQVYAIDEKLKPGEYLGPIGVLIAIASIYFKENKTDLNVIECGRGGRYDDTNVLDHEWAVITPIIAEHVKQLGPTIDHIIHHKLGIIKERTKKAYISKQEGSVLEKIKQQLKDEKATIYYYGEDFKATLLSMNTDGTHFHVETASHSFKNLQTPLLGSFQAENAATAIKVCEDIIGKKINDRTVRHCFQTIQWPGRCEIIGKNPTVIVDGAIHEQSAKYLKEVLSTFGEKRIVAIIGVPSDKDYKGVIKVISSFAKELIITKPEQTYLPFPKDALAYAKKYIDQAVEFYPLAKAVDYAYQKKDIDILLIVGTQSLIGNAKRLWNQSLLHIGK